MAAPLVLPAADDGAIAQAVEVLRGGGLVVLPTDTVYGLAAALDRPEALRRVFAVKGRPQEKELPVLLAGSEELAAVAGVVAPTVVRFAARFWPGPLTIVVAARAGLPREVLGPDATVGVRVPDHSVARAVLGLAGGALAVTSANRSGSPPATTAVDAADQLGDAVDLILDAGTTPGGMASTVIGFDGGRLRLFREGPLRTEELETAWSGTQAESGPAGGGAGMAD